MRHGFLKGSHGDLAHQWIGLHDSGLERQQSRDIGGIDAVDLACQILSDRLELVEFGKQVIGHKQPLQGRLEHGDAAVEDVEILLDPLQFTSRDHGLVQICPGMRQRLGQTQHQVLLIHLELRDDPAGIVAVGKMHIVKTLLETEGADQQRDAGHQKQTQQNARCKPRRPAQGLVQDGIEIRCRGLGHSDNTFNLLSCHTLRAK